MTETQIRRRICVFSVYIHHFEQGTDTGLKINLLQEYNFIALDIFRKNIYNKGIQNELQEMVDKERARADRAEVRTNEAEQEKQQALEKVKEIQQKYEELLQQQNKTQ